MKISSAHEKFNRFTVITAIIMLVTTIFSLFLELIINKEAAFSFAGILWILKHSSLYWIILSMNLLLPTGVYLLSRKFAKELTKVNKQVDQGLQRMQQIEAFTQELIQDNFATELNNNGENDKIGSLLLNLRDTLKLNKENNLKLRKEEEERSWIANGLAHFSEILRNYIHDQEQLSFQVIRDLTKYVNAVQGGFYILDDNDPNHKFFNLISFFAYDRKKFTDQKINWGDGLIGTCALEQKTIHMRNLPPGYITVTSGLGDAPPNSILIVPMQYENQIYGILEFASFGSFEPNHVTLIEKTAGSVAATLSASKINLKTEKLLEESKAQAQVLAANEEEMRQNMEELLATQEAATRQAEQFLKLEETINKNLIHAEFDTDGKLLSANQLFLDKLERTNDQNVNDIHIFELIHFKDREWFKGVWKKVAANEGQFKGHIRHVTQTGKDLWTFTILNILESEETSLSKILYLGIEFNEEKMMSQKKDLLIESVEKTAIHFELDINGNFLFCNNNFIQLFKLSKKDVKSLVIFDLINPIEVEAFNKSWDALLKGADYKGTIRGKTGDGKEIWIKGELIGLNNMASEIESVIFLGKDITREMKMEVEIKEFAETVRKQDRMLKDAEKELLNKLRETKTELLKKCKETEHIKDINESILEGSPNAIITISHDNRIIFFNKAAELLWELDRKNILNQNVNILFPEKLAEKDELIGSFIRPGDYKITGKRKSSLIIDGKGKEKRVLILLTKARVEKENIYMAFIQSIEG
jgi:PAS domain S-box-containing protein